MEYIDFASQISFYEFNSEEFKPPHFDTISYEEEIKSLKDSVTIEGLAELLCKRPKLFDVLEEIFQLDHFTDAQYIHFCFDVNKLNNTEDSLVLKYIQNQVFKFENGKENAHFLKIFNKVSNNYSGTDTKNIFYTKRSIVNYLKNIMDRKKPKKRKILYHHLENSIETRLRIATYLIENLNAPDLLSALDVKEFLKQKRHPIDTKGLRGRFGTNKISEVLEEAGFVDVTGNVSEKVLSPKDSCDVSNRYSYIREKCVDGIIKRSNKKLKKFDFILLRGGYPRILIETNFYSTSGGGTKIGINENEYTALHADISKFNQEHGTNLLFMWVTDGNYWLSRGGEGRFDNLKTNFFTGPYDLLNYNLLKKALPDIKESLLNDGGL